MRTRGEASRAIRFKGLGRFRASRPKMRSWTRCRRRRMLLHPRLFPRCTSRIRRTASAARPRRPCSPTPAHGTTSATRTTVTRAAEGRPLECTTRGPWYHEGYTYHEGYQYHPSRTKSCLLLFILPRWLRASRSQCRPHSHVGLRVPFEIASPQTMRTTSCWNGHRKSACAGLVILRPCGSMQGMWRIAQYL